MATILDLIDEARAAKAHDVAFHKKHWVGFKVQELVDPSTYGLSDDKYEDQITKQLLGVVQWDSEARGHICRAEVVQCDYDDTRSVFEVFHAETGAVRYRLA